MVEKERVGGGERACMRWGKGGWVTKYLGNSATKMSTYEVQKFKSCV